MSIRSTLLAVGLAAGLLVAPVAQLTSVTLAHAEPVAAQAVANPTESTAAADWLNSQFVDGSYLAGWDGSGDPGNTVDAVLGLVAAQAHLDTAQSATDWLAGQASVFTDGGSNAGRAAKLAIVAAAMGRDATDFGGVHLISAMKADDPSLAGNPYSLALIVLGLARHGEPLPDSVRTALLATQDAASGAFGFGPFWPADPDSTGLMVQGLQQFSTDAELQEAAARAVAYLQQSECTVAACEPAGPTGVPSRRTTPRVW